MSHRTPGPLARCLGSIPPSCHDRTTVVENGACRESVQMVERSFPWVDLLVEENAGFGHAVDRAVRRGRAPAVLVLNADTEVRPEAPAHLAGYLSDHPRCAIVGPRIVGDDGRLQPSCYPWPSPLDHLLAELRLFEVARRASPGSPTPLRLWAHADRRQVPWVLGCAFALRRDAYLEVGGFDPGFFLYFEEVDLSWRLRAAGWTTDFTPGAEIVHTGGASTAGSPASSRVTYYESMARWYRLHRPDRLGRLRWAVGASLLPLSAKAMLGLAVPDRRQRARADLSAWGRIAWRTALGRGR